MGKLLSWVVLIAVAYLALRFLALSQRRRERSAAAPPETPGESGGQRQVGSEMMVRCAHCGVHLPASEAIHDGERTYCDRAHRDADRAGQPRA